MAEDDTTMTTITDTLDDAGTIALGTTKALGRTLLFGAVPLLEFGILILLTVAIIRLPLKFMNRGE